MSVRRILLIGRDPYLTRNALLNGGFGHAGGFEIIEAGGAESAISEVARDDSIVAAVVSLPGVLYQMRGSDIERCNALPIVVCWNDVDAQDMVGARTRTTGHPANVPDELRFLLENAPA
jgi:hypothetical protein